MSWHTLPVEVQHMILQKLADDKCISRIASSCREWQTFIEAITFRQLTLTPARVNSLAHIVSRQRIGFVKYIHLCIEFLEIDSPQNWTSWLERAHSAIKSPIRSLLATLSGWQSEGLMLDISINCQTDLKHHFKEPCADHSRADHSRADHSRADDTYSGWTGIEPVSLRIGYEPNLLSGTHGHNVVRWLPLFVELACGLQPVKVVTSLLLRRQTQRWATEAESIKDLLRLFPRLQKLHYEYWRAYEIEQEVLDRRLLRLIECRIGRRLKSVVLFEDFNHEHLEQDGTHEMLGPALSAALARASLGLEHLSASFGIDAVHFFSSSQANWVWDRLTSLTLTSPILVPDKHHLVNDLLQVVAIEARKMPKISAIQLWNYKQALEDGESPTCLFTYRISRVERRAYLVWKANWSLYLDDEVVQSWEDTTHKYSLLELCISKELLPHHVRIKSHGDAIHVLQLAQVVHPLSLWQIRKENS